MKNPKKGIEGNERCMAFCVRVKKYCAPKPGFRRGVIVMFERRFWFEGE